MRPLLLLLIALTACGAEAQPAMQGFRKNYAHGPAAAVIPSFSLLTDDVLSSQCAGTLSGVTDTRASDGACTTATGVSFLTSNAPRVQAEGLLVELGSSNMFQKSEDLSASPWSRSFVSQTANATTSPDGTADALSWFNVTGGNNHWSWQSITYTNGQPYSWSAYNKANTNGFWGVRAGPFHNVFTLSDGTATALLGGTGVGSSTSVGSGWWRCMIRQPSYADSTGSANIIQGNGDTASHSVNDYAVADNTTGIYNWGNQLENLPYATSYIRRTGTGSASRATDVVTFTNPLKDWQTSWVFRVRALPDGQFWARALTQGLFQLGTNGAANSASLSVDTAGKPVFSVYDATGTEKKFTATAALDATTYSSSRNIRAVNIAGTLTVEVDGLVVPGASSGSGTGIITTQPTTAYLGSLGSASQFGGQLRDVCVGSTTGCPRTSVSLIALGDSITEAAPLNRWTLQLQTAHGRSWNVSNQGVSGYTSAQVDTLWTATARAQQASYVTVLVGTADLNALTPAQILANISTVVNDALADGHKVVVMTILPRKPTIDANDTATLLAANALILGLCPHVNLVCLDTYTVMGDPGDPAKLNTAYDSGDHLHPNQAGQDALYAAISAVVPFP